MEDEIPDWLGSLESEGDSAPVASVPETLVTDPSSAAPVSEEKVLPEEVSDPGIVDEPDELPSDDGIPDWLAAMQSEVGDSEPEIEAQPSPIEDLAEEGEPSSPVEQPGVPEAVSEPPEAGPVDEEKPDPDQAVKATAAFLTPDDSGSSTEDVDALLSMEMPDWLSEVETTAGPKDAPELEHEPESGDLRPADLPSWVQAMRPVEAFVPSGDQPGAGQPAEDKGPLAGLSGVLPLVPGVGPSSKPKTYSIKLQASDEQLASAELLEQMLEGDVYTKPSSIGSSLTSQRFLRMIIFALLLLVTGFSLFAGTELTQIPLTASLGTAQAHAYVQNELLPDSAVLLIFDYQAAYAAEMEAVAAPLVDYMMTIKHPRLSLLAAKPTSAGLSDRFMRKTQPAQTYANLGYLPGDAAGALAFVQDPVRTKPVLADGQNAWQTTNLQGVTSISNFAAIFLLTDEAETARIWIEQTQGRRLGTRLIVLANAQAGPLLLPYLESGQIDGLVTGLDGGGAIEQVNSGRPGKIRQYWDAFSFGLMMTIFTISIGSLWSLFMAWQSQRASHRQDKG
jgi:hypothetical protein